METPIRTFFAQCKSPPSHAPCGGSDRPIVASGRWSLPYFSPCHPPPRFVGAFPYLLPHVDRHLSDSAALVRLSRGP